MMTCENLFRKRYGEIKDRFERKLLRFSHNQIEFRPLLSFPGKLQPRSLFCHAQRSTEQKIANPLLVAVLPRAATDNRKGVVSVVGFTALRLPSFYNKFSRGNKLSCKCLINCTYLFGSLASRVVSFISETYLQAVFAACSL